VEETSNAMALDGIMFEGVSVRVRRPNDYNPAAASALGPSVPNPNLNLAAIGLQAGGMNAVRAPPYMPFLPYQRFCTLPHT
jgi:splicing factor U2AF subunit